MTSSLPPPPALTVSRSASCSNTNSSTGSASSASANFVIRRARLAGFTPVRATLRCVESRRTLELPVEKLPVLSRVVEYVLNEAKEVERVERGAVRAGSISEVSKPGAPPTCAALKRLRMLAGGDLSVEEMGLDKTLERSRATNFDAYNNATTQAWCELFPFDEPQLVRWGLPLDAVGRVAACVMEWTLDARPWRGPPPSWCSPNVLGLDPLDAVAEAHKRGWIEYDADKGVRLAGACAIKRMVRTLSESEFEDCVTKARYRASWTLADFRSDLENAHEWRAPSEFKRGTWLIFPPLLRWRLVDSVTKKEIEFPAKPLRVDPESVSFTAPPTTSSSAVLHTSSNPHRSPRFCASKPVYEFRGASRALSFTGGADYVPWGSRAHAFSLRGSARFVDRVAYSWTADSCDVDAWRAALFSKSRTLFVIVEDQAKDKERARECFQW